jgi:hypothetical protein
MPSNLDRLLLLQVPCVSQERNVLGKYTSRNVLLLASELPQLMSNCHPVLFITNGFKYTVLFQKKASQLRCEIIMYYGLLSFLC